MDHFQGPLTAEHGPMLLQMLQQNVSLGADEARRKQLTETMSNLEQCEGYCTLLHSVIVNKQNDASMRILAIICFKRAVEKLWKPRVMTASRLVSAAEKAQLRPRLFELMAEPSRLHSNHIALLFAAVAQADFPSDWSNPMGDLVAFAQSVPEGSAEHLMAAIALHHTTKALAAKVIPRIRAVFERTSPAVLQHVVPLYSKNTTLLLEALSKFSQGQVTAEQLSYEELQTIVKVSWYSLKVACSLVLYGVPALGSCEPACKFLSILLEHMKAFEACRLAIPDHPLSVKVEKFLVVMMGFVRGLQVKKFVHFAPFLGPFLEFSWGSLATCNGNLTHFLSKLFAMRLLFIKDTLEIYCVSENELAVSCAAKFRIEPPPDSLRKARAMAIQVLSKERVMSLGSLLVTRFFPLSEDDLELWSSSPEDYLVAREREDDSVCSRVAAKNLFKVLLVKLPDCVAELTKNMLASVWQTNGSSSLGDVLARDAVYFSLGLSHHYLAASLDIEALMQAFLVKDLQDQGNTAAHQVVAKTRIVWLLGYWVTGISAATRVSVYQLFVSSMESADLVLAMTACNSLSQVVDDMGFSMEQFGSFVNGAFERLFACMKRCKEISSLQMLLGVLSVLIDMLGDKIAPYVDNILRCLSGLWEGAQAHGIMKSSVIQSLAKLVSVLGPSVSSLLSLLIPVIRSSTDLQQPHAAYMLEDGLLVWKYTVLQASVPDKELVALFPNLLPVIQCSTEHLECCLRILEGYVLLGRGEFLQAHGQTVIMCLLVYLGNVQAAGTTLLTKTVQTIIQVFPQQGPTFLEPVLGKALYLVFNAEEPLDCKQAYVVMLCVLAYHNAPYFARLCAILGEQLPQEQRREGPFILLAFIDFAYEQLEVIRSPDLRKSLCLGLLASLACGVPEVLAKITILVDGALSTMHDADTCCRYAVSYVPPDAGEAFSIADEAIQRLFAEDPIYTVKLRQFAMHQLQAASAAYGQAFQQAVATMPSKLLEELQNPAPPVMNHG